jgi:hypothetical protein
MALYKVNNQFLADGKKDKEWRSGYLQVLA